MNPGRRPMGRNAGLLLTLLVSAIPAAPASSLWAFDCRLDENESGPSCKAHAECSSEAACSTAILLSADSSACVAGCLEPGADPAAGRGRWSTPGPPVDSDNARLTELLTDLGRKTRLYFKAPRLNPESRVSIRISPLPLDWWIHSLAKQLYAVPILLAGLDNIELIPEAELPEWDFAPGPETPLTAARFRNFEAGSAVTMIAAVGRVALLLPQGLGGTVDGDFSGLGWKSALEMALRNSGNHDQVIVTPNGLVEIVP